MAGDLIFFYTRVEMNGGLNGKEIDEGNASSVAYLSA